MKIAPAKAEAFLARPDPSVAAILLYGPDAGQVRERGAALVLRALGVADDPFRLADLTGREVGQDPARLVDEAASQSLMGGRRVVRVRESAESVTEPLRRALDGAPGDTLIIVEAGELTPRSGLRKLAEGHDRAAAVPCYLPDGDAIAGLARQVLKEAGKTLDPEAETALVDSLAADRQLARRSLEKLVLYLGDEPVADMAAVRATVGDSAEQSLSELALSVGDGDMAAVDRALATLGAEGTSPVGILRALQRHFQRLHQAAAAMAGGAAPDQAMGRLRPPVFFKEKGRFGGQLRRWPVARIEDALARLMEAEAQTKRTGAPDAAICARVAYQVTRMAGTPGRR
ncbi:MAG: DNA polymerase III subunit delta [Azospirillaceae bacterium]